MIQLLNTLVMMPIRLKILLWVIIYMQPFFTTKPTGEGTGLGLSVTHDTVIKVYAGSIIVESKEGNYTTFTVLLPLS